MVTQHSLNCDLSPSDLTSKIHRPIFLFSFKPVEGTVWGKFLHLSCLDYWRIHVPVRKSNQNIFVHVPRVSLSGRVVDVSHEGPAFYSFF